MILVDTDVLTALVNRGDASHEACVQALRSLQEPLATVWPVLASAVATLRDPRGQVAILTMVSRGAVRLLAVGTEDLGPLAEILALPMARRPSLAHATLLRVAERENVRTLFTLSARELRRAGGRGLHFLPFAGHSPSRTLTRARQVTARSAGARERARSRGRISQRPARAAHRTK